MTTITNLFLFCLLAYVLSFIPSTIARTLNIETGSHKETNPSFGSHEPIQVITLFHSIARSVPSLHHPGMCNLNGSIVARIYHYDKFTHKFMSGMVNGLSKAINPEKTQGHLQKMTSHFYSDGNEEAHVTFEIKYPPSKTIQIPSGKAMNHGIVQPSFHIDNVPCLTKWLPIQVTPTVVGFDTAQVQVINEEGYSILSDVDDTIRITNVLDKKEALKSTFLRDFVPTHNFPAFYQRLNHELTYNKNQPPIWHYVSGSPHQLYHPIRDFISRYRYPMGSLYLQTGDIGFWEKTQAHKLNKISELMNQFPKRKYVLIGDSGELDPETYGIVYRDAIPKGIEIKCIYIRKVPVSSHDQEALKHNPERFEKAFQGISRSKWVVFNDPSELKNIKDKCQ